jgi:multimeric flavodoxin WrbA
VKIIAVNGSPRKLGNTATLLENALAGAASQGAETELVHLYDLAFTGCRSCYACKLKGSSERPPRCAVRDDLSPVLERVAEADAVIMGSPIYLAMISGEMKCFLERFLYPCVSYATRPPASRCTGRMRVGFVYTLGVDEATMKAMGYDWQIKVNQAMLGYMVGSAESLVVNDTLMFDDYSRYETAHDAAAKQKRHREVFPQDCRKAYEMGVRLVQGPQGA